MHTTLLFTAKSNTSISLNALAGNAGIITLILELLYFSTQNLGIENETLVIYLKLCIDSA